jgi:hypothetical protein
VCPHFSSRIDHSLLLGPSSLPVPPASFVGSLEPAVRSSEGLFKPEEDLENLRQQTAAGLNFQRRVRRHRIRAEEEGRLIQLARRRTLRREQEYYRWRTTREDSTVEDSSSSGSSNSTLIGSPRNLFSELDDEFGFDALDLSISAVPDPSRDLQNSVADMPASVMVKIPPFAGKDDESLQMFFRRFDMAVRWTTFPVYPETQDGVLAKEQDTVLMMQNNLAGVALRESNGFLPTVYDSLERFKGALAELFPEQEREVSIMEMRQHKAIHNFAKLSIVNPDGTRISPELYVARARWFKRFLPESYDRQLANRFLEGMANEDRRFGLASSIPAPDFSFATVVSRYRQAMQGVWVAESSGGVPEDDDELLGLKKSAEKIVGNGDAEASSGGVERAKGAATVEVPIKGSTGIASAEAQAGGVVPEGAGGTVSAADLLKFQGQWAAVMASQNERMMALLSQNQGFKASDLANILSAAGTSGSTSRIQTVEGSSPQHKETSAPTSGANIGADRQGFMREFQPYRRPNIRCFKCGGTGHISPDCNSANPLPAAEQDRLRDARNRARWGPVADPSSGSNAVPLGQRSEVTAARRIEMEESDVEDPSGDAHVRPQRAPNVRVMPYDQDPESSPSEDESLDNRPVPVRASAMDMGAGEGPSVPRPEGNFREDKGKRRRVRTGSDPGSSDNDDERAAALEARRSRRKAPLPMLKVRPKPKELEKLQGMVGRPPFDFHNWLTETKIEMTVLEFLQASPAARRQLGWHMALANPGKRARKGRKKPGRDEDHDEDVDIRHCEIADIRPANHFGSFYVTLRIRNPRGGKKVWRFTRAILDPGSDINLITADTADTLDPEFLSTKGSFLSGVAMRTADGSRHRLKKVAKIGFDIAGASYQQEFFLMPVQGNDCGFSILLGLPWLYDAYAVFDIRAFRYTIQSPEGEIIVIQGPEYKPKQYLAVEYPITVEQFRNSVTGKLTERYSYGDDLPSSAIGQPDLASSTMGQPDLATDAQVLQANGVPPDITRLVVRAEAESNLGDEGKFFYCDPRSYLECFGVEGEFSSDAIEWLAERDGESVGDILGRWTKNE